MERSSSGPCSLLRGCLWGSGSLVPCGEVIFGDLVPCGEVIFGDLVPCGEVIFGGLVPCGEVVFGGLGPLSLMERFLVPLLEAPCTVARSVSHTLLTAHHYT